MGNIAGDSAVSRAELLALDAATTLLNLLRIRDNPLSLLKVICWNMSVLCKSSQPTLFHKLQPCVIAFKCFLEQPYPDIVSDALWAIVYLTNSPTEEIIRYILGKIPLKTILKHVSDPVLKKPALTALGNLSCGPMECLEELMSLSSLQILAQELAGGNDDLIGEICGIVSNLAQTSSRVQKLMHSGLIKRICEIVLCPASVNSTYAHKTKTAAIYALSDATEEATEKQLWKMFDYGIVDAFWHAINWENASPDVLLAALQGLDNVMTAGQGGEDEVNKIAERFRELHGLEKVSQLEYEVKNEAVVRRAQKIIDMFGSEHKEYPTDLLK